MNKKIYMRFDHENHSGCNFTPSFIIRGQISFNNSTFFVDEFNIKIYNLRITYDYEQSTIQYHKTIPRGAKDHDYPRAIHMNNINLKLKLNRQLRETITNNGTEKRDSMIGERYKNEHGVVA